MADCDLVYLINVVDHLIGHLHRAAKPSRYSVTNHPGQLSLLSLRGR